MDIAATARMGAAAAPMPANAVTPPDDLAAAQFNQVMNASPAPLTQAIREAYPTGTTGPVSLGDSILSGMQNLSSDFQQSWRAVNTALDSSSMMTMSDMLKLQIGIVQMSIQYDLVGKAISRSTQNLDQLVKMQ
jgi:type III secretion protein I